MSSTLSSERRRSRSPIRDKGVIAAAVLDLVCKQERDSAMKAMQAEILDLKRRLKKEKKELCRAKTRSYRQGEAEDHQGRRVYRRDVRGAGGGGRHHHGPQEGPPDRALRLEQASEQGLRLGGE